MKRLVLMLICLMLLLTGCEQKNEEIVEITLVHGWGSTDDDHVAMRQIYQDFEKENPDIKLKLISLPTMDELIRKLEDSIMVGDIPDIVFLAGQGRDSIFEYMVERQYALDLMPYLQEDPAFRASIPESMLEYWTDEENRIFTISDVMMTGGGYWYNRDIASKAGIKKIPETWEEFNVACWKVDDWARRTGKQIQALQLSTEGYLYFAGHALTQKGAVCENNRMIIDQEKTMETLEFLENIHQFSVGHDGTGKQYNYRDETGLFNQGKLAIYVNGVWGASMINPELDVAYALLPSEGDTSISCESSGVGYVLGNTGDYRTEQASVRFLKYMCSEKTQRRLLIETQQVPSNPNIHIQDFADQMPRFCQAVMLSQNAERKIQFPQQLWSEQQCATFEKYIIGVLSGEIKKQTLIDLLRE